MEKLELEISRNAEGGLLTTLMNTEEGNGYRIAGPKAWGGSTILARIMIDPDELIIGLKECGVDVIKPA